MKSELQGNLLGICIPTYNRSKYLRQCLLAFIEQVREYGYPIFVSDNGSNDDTKNVVKEMISAYPNIYYSRNQENLGIVRNFLKVIEMATTDYVWLFGDDDTIPENAIGTITKSIQKQEVGYLILNSAMYDKSMSVKEVGRYLPFDRNITYDKYDHQKALLDVTTIHPDYCGYLALMVIRKDAAKKELERLKIETKDFKELNEFLTIPLYFRLIIENKGILISDPLINVRTGNGRVALGTWIYDFPKALSMLDGPYNKRILGRIGAGKFSIGFISSAVSIKGHSINYSDQDFTVLVKKNQYLRISVKMLIFIILLMPDNIGVYVYRLLRSISRKFLSS